MTELQEEIKRKETRWTSSNSRLRSKIEQLEQENSELKEEIKLMEKRRLEWLQKEQNKVFNLLIYKVKIHNLINTSEAVVDLQLPMQSVPITTMHVSQNSVHGEVYSILHYVIKFFSDLRQVCGFLCALWFPPPIKLTATI